MSSDAENAPASRLVATMLVALFVAIGVHFALELSGDQDVEAPHSTRRGDTEHPRDTTDEAATD